MKHELSKKFSEALTIKRNQKLNTLGYNMWNFVIKKFQIRTEKDIDTWLTKTWTAIDHMEIRPDRYNETQFLPGSGHIDTTVWVHYLEARRQLHKNAASNIEQVLAATPHKAPTIRPLTSHHENYPS